MPVRLLIRLPLRDGRRCLVSERHARLAEKLLHVSRQPADGPGGRTDAPTEPRTVGTRQGVRRLGGKAGCHGVLAGRGVERGMTYEAFRKRVAPRGHDQLVAAIERMTRGEADVLWPGRCSFFARTAGTTGNGQRLLPVSDEMLRHFRPAEEEALLYYTPGPDTPACSGGGICF